MNTLYSFSDSTNFDSIKDNNLLKDISSEIQNLKNITQLNTSVFSTNTYNFNQYKDPFIGNDISTFSNSNTLGYTGLLNILSNVANSIQNTGLTEIQFQDLQFLVSNLNSINGIQVSQYLSSISNKLVKGDPANENYTGGQLLSSPLGNLNPGSSQLQISQLINKWFLGSDTPSPIFSDTNSYSYLPFYNPIFSSSGPLLSDINQQQEGDCYLLASLAEVVNCEPSVIESMITSNGNGVYGVRFYLNSIPTYVTVNNYLPVSSNGTLGGNNAVNIWASLIEKAYVQLNETPGALPGRTPGNSYALLNGGNADPITQITGKSVEEFNSSYYVLADWLKLENYFTTAIKTNFEIDLASYSTSFGANGKINFVNNHMFSVIGYDSTSKNFILRNPWGVGDNQNWNTTFEASVADMFKDQATLYLAYGSPNISPLLGVTSTIGALNSAIATSGVSTIVGSNELSLVNFKNTLCQYTITKSNDNLIVKNSLGDSTTLLNVFRLAFTDTNIAFDFLPKNNGFDAAVAIGTAFGIHRIPDLFSAVISLYDSGFSSTQVAALICKLGLIENKIGFSNENLIPNDQAWVDYIYSNIVSIHPDPLTLKTYVDQLLDGTYTRASLLEYAFIAASNGGFSAESKLILIGLESNGLSYTPI